MAKIPKTFQEVEWLEGSKSINLHYYANARTKVVLKYLHTNDTGNCIFGNQGTSDSHDWRFFVTGGNSYFDVVDKRINIGKIPSKTQPTIVELGNFYYKFNDVIITSGASLGGYTSSQELAINGLKSGVSEKWYYVDIYENNILIHSYKPVFRISDNQTGMYDTIDGVFYPSSSGNMAIGPIIEAPTYYDAWFCGAINGITNAFIGNNSINSLFWGEHLIENLETIKYEYKAVDVTYPKKVDYNETSAEVSWIGQYIRIKNGGQTVLSEKTYSQMVTFDENDTASPIMHEGVIEWNGVNIEYSIKQLNTLVYQLITDGYIYDESNDKYYERYEARIEDTNEPIIDLNAEWAVDTVSGSLNIDDNYNYYMSNSNYHVSNGYSQFCVKWSGVTEMTFLYRSYAEGGYDYLVINGLDKPKFTSNPSSTTVGILAHTRNAQSTTYKTLTVQCDEGEHFIWFCYRKDSSGDSASDRAFVGVPKEITSVEIYLREGEILNESYSVENIESVPSLVPKVMTESTINFDGITTLTYEPHNVYVRKVDNLSQTVTFPMNETSEIITRSGSFKWNDVDVNWSVEQLGDFDANRTIYYTSSDGNIVQTTNSTGLSSLQEMGLIANIYVDGQGYMVFDKDVTEIKDSIFNNCTNIKTITVPSIVTTMGSYVFATCNHLVSVDGLDNITSIGASVFKSCRALNRVNSNVDGEVNLNKVVSLGVDSFNTCVNIKIVNTNNLQRIVNGTFSGCTSLTTINFSNVDNINSDAFYGCRNLTNIDLSNVKALGQRAFHSCSGLTFADLSNVTTVETATFANCTSLQTVSFANARSINTVAFSNCTSLENIYCYSVPPTIKNTSEASFLNVKEGGTLHVPSGLIDMYTDSANNWMDTTYGLGAKNWTIVDDLPEIVDSRIMAITYNVSSTTSPTTIKSSYSNYGYIRYNGIIYMGVGTTFTFNDTGLQTLYYCNAEKIPTTSGPRFGSFYDIESIKSIAFSDDLVNFSIGSYSITSVDNLESVYLGNVTEIQTYAMNIPTNCIVYTNNPIPPTLGYLGFNNMGFKIYVPDEAVTAYKTATNWTSYASKIYPLSQKP